MTRSAQESWFRWGLVVLVGAAILARALSHEPWQDELHPWGEAQTATSVADFLWISRYDGHCRLWPLLVLGLHRTFGRFEAVQALHALTATAAIAVFTFASPFSRLQKVLFALGYFAFFEYAVIARCYAIALLALCVACAAWAAPAAKRTGGGVATGRPVALGVALFLLTQSSIFGVFVAGSMALAWVVAHRARHPDAQGSSRLRAWLPAACAGVGAVLAALQVIPPADSTWGGWVLYRDYPRMVDAASEVVAVLVPLPVPGRHFWNTSLLAELTGRPGPPTWAWVVAPLMSALLYAAFAVCLRRHRAPLLVWLCVPPAIVAFTYLKYMGDMRQQGHIFLALVAACWIARSEERTSSSVPSVPAPPGGGAGERDRRLDRFRDRLFTCVLVAQALGGVLAAALETRAPFSASAACADYLRANALDRLPIVAELDADAAPVAVQLDRPFYSPRSHAWGRFVVYRRGRVAGLTDDDVVAAARSISDERGSDVVLVLTRPLARRFEGLEPLAEFPAGVVPQETYVIHRLRRPR